MLIVDEPMDEAADDLDFYDFCPWCASLVTPGQECIYKGDFGRWIDVEQEIEERLGIEEER